ncbi:hypothetical protein AB1N83_012401, partial [Pleurotus pulmonarius]
SLKTCQ